MRGQHSAFSATGGLVVDAHTTVQSIDQMRQNWLELYDRPANVNPYSHPAWALATYASGRTRRLVLTVRDRGRLVAVAPLELARLGRHPASVTRLGIAGTMHHPDLLELPQVLCAPEYARSSLRAVTEFLCTSCPDWDWWRVPLGGAAGWFELDWLPHDSKFLVVGGPLRGTTVVDLPGQTGVGAPRLASRNLRESVRRGRNRLNKAFGAQWTIEIFDRPDEVNEAARIVLDLHKARARLTGHKRHDDYVDGCEGNYLLDVIRRMRAGEVSVRLLRVPTRDGVPGDQEVIAGLITLATPAATHCCVSGVSPAGWEFSSVTVLQHDAMNHAAELGKTRFSLATGPDQAKLRWNNKIVYNPDFFVVRDHYRSMLAFSTYRAAAVGASLARERRRGADRVR